ncbi:MAG: hypothetical protein V3T49_03300 [Dehalococcoidia bacterium]
MILNQVQNDNISRNLTARNHVFTPQEERRSTYWQMLESGEVVGGIAIDDAAAALYRHGELH